MKRKGIGLAILFLCGGAGFAEPIVLPLWPNDAPGGEAAVAETPQLTVYLPTNPTGAAVVIFPGGGYWGLAMDHEGHQAAQWLNSLGAAGIIVSYRRGPDARHPVPLLDAQRAIRTVRARAKEWQIDPARIGVIGFSAGGHLASCTGVHFDLGDSANADPVQRISCRPDFMILVYPVISMTREYMHRGSMVNLLGDPPDPQLAIKMSTDQQVTPQTPPTFLILTNEDTVVPAENSVFFYLALRKAGVAAEMHIFERGPHGFGLAPLDPALSKWMELCRNWMMQRGILN
ncbi:MAG: alpha/beta hydrolase [candidate division KSB1 bacterium]|nr:alpha/beta hydrolase [candidate division KSB1 bacterium]